MGKVAKYFLWIISGLCLLAILLVIPVDESDYLTTDYYKHTLARLDSVRDVLEGQTSKGLEVGWGSATITPEDPVRLTGNNWTPYRDILDSVYVRCFLLKNGDQKIAMLNYDLWIMHPNLSSYLRDHLSNRYPGISGFYFTANHSHTSIGGWGRGLLGRLIMGGNHPHILDFLVRQSTLAIEVAQNKLDSCLVGYSKIDTQGLVVNRLDTTGYLDRTLRVIKFRNRQGEQAVFSTFSAHSVYMNKDINTLSADYPGGFLKDVTAHSSIDFAAFAPGATGSHTPPGRKPFTVDKMLSYGRALSNYLIELVPVIQLDTLQNFKFARWPINIPTAHFRIANRWRLRPWLFEQAIGKASPEITIMRLANTILVAMPIELSGEYYHQLDPIAASRGLNLVITSFNGDYLGYAVPEKYYYSLNRAEVRDMNWYGPQSGEYFAALIKELLLTI